jgi:hypothetical protein
MSGRTGGGMAGRTGAAGAGRSSGSMAGRSSADRASADRSLNIRAAVADGQWHSFGGSSASVRSASAGFVGGVRPGAGLGFRGGFGGFGCCGFGRGGWGFGFGGPFWGPYWAFAWDPWWYNPYWYGTGAYYSYQGYGSDYGYDWSDDPPPYRPGAYTPDANLSPNYHLNSSLSDGPEVNVDPSVDPSYDAGLSDSAVNGWVPSSAAGAVLAQP